MSVFGAAVKFALSCILITFGVAGVSLGQLAFPGRAFAVTGQPCPSVGAQSPSAAQMAAGGDYFCEDWAPYDLENTNLDSVQFAQGRLSGSGAQLDSVEFSNSDFSGADLSGATLDGTRFIDGNLDGANLDGIRIRRGFFGNLPGGFIDSSLRGATLRNITDAEDLQAMRSDFFRSEFVEFHLHKRWRRELSGFDDAQRGRGRD